MGSSILSFYQYGIETTPGNAVAASRVLGAAPKAVPIDRQWTPIKLANGQRWQYTRKRNDELLVRDSLSFDAEHPLYFQALPILHQCSLDGTITPAEQTGGQSDYKWDVAPSGTAANAPDTITLEMGDDVQAFETEYAMFHNLKMGWTIPQDGSVAPLTGEFTYFSRQMTPTTKTGSLTHHSGLEFINTKLSRLYLDTSWAGLGGSEVANTLRGGEIEIDLGLEPKMMGSANKYFDTFGEGHIGAMITLDLEGNSSADSIFDLYQAGTERALRLKFPGSQIGSGVNYLYQLDLYGYFADVQPLSNRVGYNNLHRAVFVGIEDSSHNFIDIDIITNHNTV